MKKWILLITLPLILSHEPLAGMALPPQAAPVGGQGAGASGALRVRTGRSMVISTEDPLRRVSVTDSEIASAAIITPNQVLVHGRKTGTVTLILWNQQDEPTAYDLVVELDVPAARETLQRMFPGEDLELFQSGDAIVVSGSVSSAEVGARALALAGTLGQNVVDLTTTSENRQTILLEVRFAEVDRTAIHEFGVNLFSTGATNTPGAISTGQFGGVSSSGTGFGTGVDVSGSQADFTLSDALNVLMFRPDLDIGAAIRALEQRSLLEILAEPTVLARNGTEASFLAGGEFPFPVVQSGAGTSSVSIEFKEFGVRLNFLPTILDDGTISLRVTPEVSALDYANALSISGFLVPALSTRRADAEVDLRAGQTFAIAGLIDQRLTEAALKVPILGDIPILGRIFRSHSSNESRTELLVMVTPRFVESVGPEQMPGVDFPQPFHTPEELDGGAGTAPTQNGSNEDPAPAARQERAARLDR
jgi:pilus assembly protein CpaC